MKAILYARYSPRPDGATSESNETQLASMRNYCAQKNYRIGQDCEFTDQEVSGGGNGNELEPAHELTQRTGLWKAIKALGKGDVLIVYRRDRLSRSVYASEYIRRIVQTKKARIESMQGLNGDTPEERLVQQILAATDEFSRKITALRTKDAMLRMQRDGRCMSKLVPYGTRAVPLPGRKTKRGKTAKGLVSVPDEQAIIQRILSMRASGPAATARLLNQDGLTIRNRPWHHEDIRRIIKRTT